MTSWRYALSTGLALALASPMPASAQTAMAPVGGQQATDDDAAAQAMDAAALAEATALIELWIEAQRTSRKIPAISAAVVKGQETIWAKGFGTTDADRQRPATADTIYSICSISKLFTSIALMQQWEQGQVRLDDPITTYLPWAQLAPDDRDSVPITLRGALTHSAGLPRESEYPYWSPPDFPFPSRDEVRAQIGNQTPLYPASREFQYSNLGLTLIGETVAAVSGMDYDAYITSKLIGPMGLTDTRPSFPTELHGGQMAVGWGSLTRDGERPLMPPFDTRGILPAAGFTSTANDLARFAAWHFRVFGGADAEVLRPSTLREMTRVQFLSPDWNTSWGLGYVVQREGGSTRVGHGGSCPGYRTLLMMDPAREMAVAVLMNASDSAGRILNGIAGVMSARGEAKVFDDPAVDLEDYAGLYDYQPWSAEAAILPWAGGLAVIDPLETNPGDIQRLRHMEGDTFRVLTDEGGERETVTFERDADGKVTHIVWFSNRYPRME